MQYLREIKGLLNQIGFAFRAFYQKAELVIFRKPRGTGVSAFLYLEWDFKNKPNAKLKLLRQSGS